MLVRSAIALVLSIVCLTSFACGIKPSVNPSESNRATAKHVRKLAEVTAQHRLGLFYKFCRGVPQNYGQAKRWFEEAAKQGHPGAQIYLQEDAPPRSPQMAIFWFSRAAEQGVVPAFPKLGQMYQEAQGVPEDFVQAYMWFHLAATDGETPSAERRDILAMKMSYTQITETQKRAREWKPTPKSVAWKLRMSYSDTLPESNTKD